MYVPTKLLSVTFKTLHIIFSEVFLEKKKLEFVVQLYLQCLRYGSTFFNHIGFSFSVQLLAFSATVSVIFRRASEHAS